MPPETISATYKASETSVSDVFSRRSKHKYITQTIVSRLAKIDKENSHRWRRVLDCSSEIRREEDHSLRTWYCENRICTICNNIKTAVNITRYRDQVQELENRKFLTLTIPSPDAENLKYRIRDMIRHFQLIKKRLNKRYQISADWTPYTFSYIRKLETTCNKKKNNFHPHFHIILNDFFVVTDSTEKTITQREYSAIFLDEWMRDFPEADRRAQNCSKATENDVKEIFKYFTKTIYKNKLGTWMLPSPDQFKTLFEAISGTRTFQTGGDIHIPEHLRSKYLKDQNPESIIYKDADKLSGSSYKWDQVSKSFFDQHTGEILGEYAGSGKLVKLFLSSGYFPYEKFKHKNLPKKIGLIPNLTPELIERINQRLSPDQLKDQGYHFIYREPESPEEIRASITGQLVNKLSRRKNFYYSKNDKFVKNEFRSASPEFRKFYKEYLNERMKKLLSCN